MRCPVFRLVLWLSCCFCKPQWTAFGTTSESRDGPNPLQNNNNLRSMTSSSGHHYIPKTLIYIAILSGRFKVSYQIHPKFRTKLVSMTEVFWTRSTKCPAQHAQLIHIGRVEPVFAQRTERLTIIMLSLSKHPVAPKPCHLAHRFSQTCILSLSGRC